MRKILKGIILSLIIIGLIKTFNEYDVIHCANHYFEQIKSGKMIEDIKIDHFNNYHNINFENLLLTFSNTYAILIEKKIKT
ncbi:hypothetical protein ACP2XG_01295 [Staphylococcus epidermidis]